MGSCLRLEIAVDCGFLFLAVGLNLPRIWESSDLLQCFRNLVPLLSAIQRISSIYAVLVGKIFHNTAADVCVGNNSAIRIKKSTARGKSKFISLRACASIYQR